MKKLLSSLALFLLCFSLSAQSYKAYCELVPSEQFNREADINVFIDFGQKTEGRLPQIADKDSGEGIVFNSAVSALNFMSKLGWKLEYVYEKASRVKYVLSKEVTDDNQITEGFKLSTGADKKKK